MSRALRCPSCGSPNDPGERRCRVCHAILSSGPGEPSSPDVHLERALRDGAPGAAVYETVSAKASGASRGSRSEVLDPLLVLTDRIAARAAEAGERFKPYLGTHPRRAQTAEARKAVAKQLEAAALAFRERRFDVAIGHLLKAITKEDADPRPWILLGEAYLRLDRPYKAAVGYLRALALDAANDNAWLGLGRALRNMDDLPGALEVLDHTVQTNPSVTEAWSERGFVLEALARPAEAAKSFEKALELRPDHPTARVAFDRLAPHTDEAAPLPVASPAEPIVSVPEAAEAEPAHAAEPPEEDELPDFGDLAGGARPEEPPASAAAPSHPARMRTFIEGLDDGLGGGIPWGRIVLVEGGPGSLKSSLVFSILARNASEAGLHGLYLSLADRTSSLLKQMGSLGLPTTYEPGSLVVLDPRAVAGLLDDRKGWIEALESAVEAVRGPHGIDVLAIDSLDALEVLASFADRRQEVYRLFEWLRDLEIPVFVIAERPEPGHGPDPIRARRDEDFLADGILHLEDHFASDHDVQRRIRIAKMRGTVHERGYIDVKVADGKIILVRTISV